MRGQHLIIAFLVSLLLVLAVTAAFGGYYQSKLPDIVGLDFPERAYNLAQLT